MSKKAQKKGHNWSWKVAGYLCCARCGLVPLRNQATQKAMAQTCHGGEE